MPPMHYHPLPRERARSAFTFDHKPSLLFRWDAKASTSSNAKPLAMSPSATALGSTASGSLTSPSQAKARARTKTSKTAPAQLASSSRVWTTRRGTGRNQRRPTVSRSGSRASRAWGEGARMGPALLHQLRQLHQRHHRRLHPRLRRRHRRHLPRRSVTGRPPM